MQVYLSALVFFWIAAKQLEEIVACENVRFQESEQKYLPNHVMKTKQADSDLVCGLYCIADKSCTSINYKTSGIGKGRCELNSKTTEETSDVDDRIHDPEFNHLVVIERDSTHVGQCPLGIESDKTESKRNASKMISDVAMTSSTILNVNSLPHFGRLRNDQYIGCAWRPAKTADQNSSWLQVDLGRLIKVSAVATQGSCSRHEWTKTYIIMYSKDGVDWKEYKEAYTIKVFNGNKDRSSVVKNHFKYPFVARFVRILPRSWHNSAALRIELFTDNCDISPIPSSKPRSCLDHLKNGLKTNGYYSIYDASSNPVIVYCDMTSESGKAWTLVMSWATRNKDMTEFRSTPLSTNSPVDENLPNWNKYRMSLSMMNDLSTQYTHWRATCGFPTHGVDYVDYVRGKFVDLDVVKFLGRKVCKRVEYVNIRGHQCSDCDLPWWQKWPDYILHTDSTQTTCGFNATEGSVYREDNFGHYAFINVAFRCTASDTATTSWWFGGSLT